jgi:hypothetical protein
MDNFQEATQPAKNLSHISLRLQKPMSGQDFSENFDQLPGEFTQWAAPRIVSVAKDPIDVLPSELFTFCIQWALPTPDQGYTAVLLQLTAVSSRWQQSIISNPALWTQITINAYDEDSLAMVATSLHLSRESMISLTVCPPMWDEWKPAFSLIASHSRRLRQITLIAAAFSDEFRNLSTIREGYLYCVALKEVLDLVGDLQSITSVDLGTPYHLPVYVPAVTPLGLPTLSPQDFRFPSTLRYMRRWTLQLPLLGTTNLPIYTLRELHTEEPMDSLSSILSNLWQVERLCVTDRDWGFLYVNIPTWTHKVPHPRYDLPNLTIFMYNQPLSDTLISLLPQVATNLRKLALRIPYGMVGFLINALERMSRLEELTLMMSTVKWTRDDTPAVHLRELKPVGTLRSLSLRNHDRPMSLEREDAASVCIDGCGELVSTLVELYPNITEGHIRLGHIMNWIQILPLLQKLNHLRRLSIDGSTRLMNAEGEANLPALEELRVEGDDVLPSIICPNILRLVYDGKSFRQLERFCQRCPALRSLTSSECFVYDHHLNSSSFSHLTNLKVTLWEKGNISEPQQMYLTSLPSLTKISLSGFEQVFCQATFLCLMLLYQPEDCPRLQELEFDSYLEWDCLFLMLEARNLSRNSSLSRISRITMPLIPYHFRSPLASLLRGESVIRPSNEDLSIAATRQVLFDATMCVFTSPQ